MAGAALIPPERSQPGQSGAIQGFGVPIALLNFNRPQMTRRVFEVIRQIKPRRLLLIADGPRPTRPDDERLCAEVRAIFDEIDWDCEVSRNFSDTNLGSFKRNSTGLNWVFDTVEEAIVLEDDCVPSLSFFRYCEELLERYRNDTRVSVISGNNFSSPAIASIGDSYHFSAYTFNWGWASWRRVWRQVDLDMSWWNPETGREAMRKIFPETNEWRYWFDAYERIRLGKQRNAWDFQMLLSSLRNSQCSVIPCVNLVSNIGFGAEATNCTDADSPLHDIPRGELEFPLTHPAEVRRNHLVDHALFIKVFNHRRPFWRRAINKLIRTFGLIRKA